MHCLSSGTVEGWMPSGPKWKTVLGQPSAPAWKRDTLYISEFYSFRIISCNHRFHPLWGSHAGPSWFWFCRWRNWGWAGDLSQSHPYKDKSKTLCSLFGWKLNELPQVLMSFPFCGACVCVLMFTWPKAFKKIKLAAHRICVATCGISDAAGRIWFPNCGLNPGSLVLGG